MGKKNQSQLTQYSLLNEGKLLETRPVIADKINIFKIALHEENGKEDNGTVMVSKMNIIYDELVIALNI